MLQQNGLMRSMHFGPRIQQEDTLEQKTGVAPVDFQKFQAEKLANIDLDDTCGICLEEFSVKDIQTFPCLNHVIHKDCYALWENSNKNKEFLCIYRCTKKDVA